MRSNFEPLISMESENEGVAVPKSEMTILLMISTALQADVGQFRFTDRQGTRLERNTLLFVLSVPPCCHYQSMWAISRQTSSSYGALVVYRPMLNKSIHSLQIFMVSTRM